MGQLKITPGRIVNFKDPDFNQVCPAIVTYVHNDTCINVCAFNPNGEPKAYTSVIQGEGPREWDWTPNQKARAALQLETVTPEQFWKDKDEQ